MSRSTPGTAGLRRRTLLLALPALAASAPCVAAEVAAYRPERFVSGLLRLWGDEHMAAVVHAWERGFCRHQPGIRFEIGLRGSGAAMPGLYGHVADLALLGRESDITDDNGFFKSVGGYKPLRFELMNGSLDVPGQSAAQAVFVHRDNPLQKLTVAQLDAVFGEEHRRSAANNIRSWGELGLDGDWKDRPIALYGYDIDSEDGLHFVRSVLAESRKLAWDRLAEFSDTVRADGTIDSAGGQIIEALQKDRYGLAISNIRYANRQVKAIAIGAHEAAPYYAATRQNVISRRYPLARRTYAFADCPPGQAMDPKLREFLRYVLSREGQRDVDSQHGYLPLSLESLREQLGQLA